jgi:hypothetical protein
LNSFDSATANKWPTESSTFSFNDEDNDECRLVELIDGKTAECFKQKLNESRFCLSGKRLLVDYYELDRCELALYRTKRGAKSSEEKDNGHKGKKMKGQKSELVFENNWQKYD